MSEYPYTERIIDLLRDLLEDLSQALWKVFRLFDGTGESLSDWLANNGGTIGLIAIIVMSVVCIGLVIRNGR